MQLKNVDLFLCEGKAVKKYFSGKLGYLVAVITIIVYNMRKLDVGCQAANYVKLAQRDDSHVLVTRYYQLSIVYVISNIIVISKITLSYTKVFFRSI